MARRKPQHKIVETNVRKFAAEKDINMVDLAGAADISRRHLYAFFAGEKDITLGKLEALADALEVDVVDLLQT